MSNLPVGSRFDRAARVYPNGECVVWRQLLRTSKPIKPYRAPDGSLFKMACWQLYMANREALCAASLFMGLSLVSNFDKLVNPLSQPPSIPEGESGVLTAFPFGANLEEVSPIPASPLRYGLKGIPRRAARIVRNAAYLLQKESGRENLTFATVTIPAMPVEDMRILHENWGKVTELYRLGLRRHLRKKGLSGQSVGVSEIQEKRHKRTGLPVLHLHTVFQGRAPFGHWALSTKAHDKIWRKAVMAVVPHSPVCFKSAANLQMVKTSASGYLGKYITKGVSEVARVVADGFAEWLPRQWWNCSRDLKRQIDVETIRVDELAESLVYSAKGNGMGVWDFFGHVSIEVCEIKDYWVATYGRLSTEWRGIASVYSRGRDMNRKVRALTQCATL